MRNGILSLAFAVLAGPTASATTVFETPQNHLLVVPLNATDFEVIESRGAGPRGIWCAAASYVDSRLTQARTGDLFVKSARGPSVSGVGRIGVVFTINGAELGQKPVQSYSISVDRAGERLPVQHAYQFCRDYILDTSDIVYRLNRSGW